MGFEFKVSQYSSHNEQKFVIHYRKWYWLFWYRINTVWDLQKYSWKPYISQPLFFNGKDAAIEFAKELKLPGALEKYLEDHKSKYESAIKEYRDRQKRVNNQNKSVTI